MDSFEVSQDRWHEVLHYPSSSVRSPGNAPGGNTAPNKFISSICGRQGLGAGAASLMRTRSPGPFLEPRIARVGAVASNTEFENTTLLLGKRDGTSGVW